MTIPVGYSQTPQFGWYMKDDGTGPYSFDGVSTMALVFTSSATADQKTTSGLALEITGAGPYSKS